MANDRARQKKLEKQKKKRAAAQKEARGNALPTSIASLVRAAPAWPVVSAHLGGTWRDTANPAIVGVMITRKMPDGRYLLGSALVDRTCLGVKDAFVMRPVTRAQLDQVLEQVAEGYGALEEVPLATAQSVLFHALDFAAAIGFAPHKDFAPSLFGPRPATLEDTPWARPERPLYVQGPDDDVARIVAQLEARVGAGKYDVTTFSEEAIAALGLRAGAPGPEDEDDGEGLDDEDDDADDGAPPPA